MKSVAYVDELFGPPDPYPAPPRRLHFYFEARCEASPDSVAVVSEEETLTYRQLDRRANQLAHALTALGIGPGDTVGILLHRSVHTYVSLLGILKAGAAFVPIDPSFPEERIRFIAEDAGLSRVLTTSEFRPLTAGLHCPALELDEMHAVLVQQRSSRPRLSRSGDPLCYIIYTSGSTGRPKGVAVRHSNICHFLSVVSPIYGVTSQDRVYQGMTIAFDFSIEEIWPALMAGATLVAGPNDSRRLGPGLADFLNEHQITVLCCVPTLLATLDRDVPSVRLLNLGGEACPRDLVQRWHRRERHILNTYGPTETTVTATWTELDPDRAVTIGRPLPGYQVYILDAELQPVTPGEAGEICIGGKGVAQGYVNRPDLTAERFVADPFSSDPLGGRLYRTGDLGRFNESGEIEYLGRIDTQVKIRGYRIELSEIEEVLLEDAAVEGALVATWERENATDLVAYLTLRQGEDGRNGFRGRLQQSLRRRLPAYMVPAYLEILPQIPMLPSGKADRSRLPAPQSARLGAGTEAVIRAETAIEARLVAVWQQVFQTPAISVEADFFTDLGGHSLLAAQVISRLREETELKHLGIGDLYACPTIRKLAELVEENSAGAASAAEATAPTPRPQPYRPGSLNVAAGGAAQSLLLYLLLGVMAAPSAILLGLRHGNESRSLFDLFAVVVPAGLIMTSILLPLAAKWLLVGRLRPGRHRIWGWFYCRWWLLRKIFAISPMNFLSGSPLLPVYARLLGARIGQGCHIGTPSLSLPDLIDIGDGAHIGYEAELQPFLVEDGWLHLDTIRIGAGAFVGTKTVLLPGAVVGEGARVKDQSLVARNQMIPNHETWTGSPIRRTAEADPLLDRLDARQAAPARWPAHLWLGFAAGVLVLELLPIAISAPGFVLLLEILNRYGLWGALAAMPLAGLALVLTTCGVVALGKRLVLPHARPGIYPLRSAMGLRKWFADHLMVLSLATTNSLYATLYTPAWLRLLGSKIGKWSEVSTVSHIDPDLLELGSETFVADMASIGASVFHNGWIGMETTRVADRSFIGNAALVRAHTEIPENCLLGVQSVPPEKPMEPGTSWLGSPAIFLPRRQESASFAEELTYRPTPGLIAGRLAIEFLRAILPAAFLYLSTGLTLVGALALARGETAWELMATLPALFLINAVAVVLLMIAFKWLVIGRYRPRVEPLWSIFVRRSELVTGIYESAAVPMLLGWLTGTPLLSWFLRGFGARIGRRVYLDTTYLTEFDLVHVGDDCSVAGPSSLQTHLFEDRVMKMSHVRIGDRCTVGARAVVLYDTHLEDDSRLDGLSLVMKGETLPSGTGWRGIPARPLD